MEFKTKFTETNCILWIVFGSKKKTKKKKNVKELGLTREGLI